MSDLVDRVYQVFDPTDPLTPQDHDLYVDLDEVRGEADLVNRLAKRITRSTEPTCQILAGHRGSGKSTELGRLQQRLETATPKRFVVFCECKKAIDPNDVDFPDVLVAIVRQMAAQLKERAGISLEPGYFKERWDKLKKWMRSDIDLKKLPLDVGFGNISDAIVGSPDAREEIRKLLEPDTSNMQYAANDVIGEAKKALQSKGFQDLAILVDDLDRMVLRAHPTAGCTMAEHLFVNRHAQLSGFMCHMVYTMPIELAYSAREQRISSLYGGRPPVVPMTKVATRPPRSKPYPLGVQKFRDVIAARLRRARAEEDQVFAGSDVQDRLISLSGGQPRELMILIREAIIAGDLPITHAAVDRPAREGTRAFARQLREDLWPLLSQVRKDGTLTRTKDNDGAVRELLDSRAVLLYVNKEEWYGVNPLVPEPPRQSEQRRPARRRSSAKKKKA